MSETVTAFRNEANGFAAVDLPLDSLDQTFGYTGSNLTSITVEYDGVFFVQTLFYTGAVLDSVTAFREPD